MIGILKLILINIVKEQPPGGWSSRWKWFMSSTLLLDWRRFNKKYLMKKMHFVNMFNQQKKCIQFIRRNLTGDSLLDGRQQPISLKGAGIQKSWRSMTLPKIEMWIILIQLFWISTPFRHIGRWRPSNSSLYIECKLSFNETVLYLEVEVE